MQLPNKKSFEPGPGKIDTDRIVIRDRDHGVGKIDKSSGDVLYRNAVTGHQSRIRPGKK